MKIKKFIKNFKSPVWWQSIFLYKIIFPVLFRNCDGISVLEEDWDSLVILDACRYDIFKEVFNENNMKGRLEYKISKGTETSSFLRENFDDEKYCDIVYITANPWVDKLLRGKLYKIISVWKYGWDEKYQTVLPKTVYEYALYAISKYPDKRIIVHFLQPHSPYPNGTGECEFGEELKAIVKGKKIKIKYKLDEKHYADVWPYIGIKSLKVDKLKEGYIQNLKLVLPYVKKLINVLPGKTVVTADHGEAFGEKIHPLVPIKVYGHPSGIKIPVLFKVPWLVVEQEEKEPPKDFEKELQRIKRKFEKKTKQKIEKAIRNLKLKAKSNWVLP